MCRCRYGKIKKMLLLFLSCVIVSNTVISDYELSKNEAQAAEVVVVLAGDLLLDLALTALASIGIYCVVDDLNNDTGFLDELKENILHPGQVHLPDAEAQKAYDYWCYENHKQVIDWDDLQNKLTQAKEKVAGWVKGNIDGEKFVGEIIDTAKNGGQLPSDPKNNKNLKELIRAGLGVIALSTALCNMAPNITSHMPSSIQSGYSSDWYTKAPDANIGDDVVMPDADGTIQFLQGKSVFTITNCPSDMNLIQVSSRYYWGNSQPVDGGGTRTYLIGVSASAKGYTGIWGEHNTSMYCTNNGLYCYCILNSDKPEYSVPAYTAPSTVDNFLNTYSLKFKETKSYDDWIKEQKKFNNNLLDVISELELKIDELVDMLEDIVEKITDPEIPPADIPGKIDPIINPEPVIPVNPDDPVPVEPVPIPDPVNPDNPTIEPGQIKQVQWTEFFPFCLVVDFIDCIKLFKATPRNPVFRIPFKYDKIGVDEEIVIDLTDYEDVWQVARTGQVILFIVGLIVLTKKFFF